MHSRRIQILGPLLDILNPSIYMGKWLLDETQHSEFRKVILESVLADIHKQVALEMGRTAQECLDLRIYRVEQKKRGNSAGPKVCLPS
jgi:hypothetical protein